MLRFISSFTAVAFAFEVRAEASSASARDFVGELRGQDHLLFAHGRFRRGELGACRADLAGGIAPGFGSFGAGNGLLRGLQLRGGCGRRGCATCEEEGGEDTGCQKQPGVELLFSIRSWWFPGNLLRRKRRTTVATAARGGGFFSVRRVCPGAPDSSVRQRAYEQISAAARRRITVRGCGKEGWRAECGRSLA